MVNRFEGHVDSLLSSLGYEEKDYPDALEHLDLDSLIYLGYWWNAISKSSELKKVYVQEIIPYLSDYYKKSYDSDNLIHFKWKETNEPKYQH